MFFSISQAKQENFSNHYQLGCFNVDTDPGWTYYTTATQSVVYKGYADVAPLNTLLDKILNQTEPELLGNFCAIVYDSSSQSIQIKSDRYRGFPIHVNPRKIVSNLITGEWTAWTDSLLTIRQDLTVKELKFDVIGSIDTSIIDPEVAITNINKILDNRTKNFLKYNHQPVRVFLSGGVDSTLVYSYLQKFTDQYEFVKCQHVDYDRFWLMNEHTLKKMYWGYTQIHHWNDPCVLTSGAPGDEFMLRSPATADLYLKFHQQNIIDLLEHPDWQLCLHHDYFYRSKNYCIFKEQTIDPEWDRQKLFWELCNNVVNDWQHWHIGNTLTWTPLRDLEIFKIMLRLPLPVAIGQIMNSDFSRKLIDRNCPNLNSIISNQKNSGAFMKNLCDFFKL